MIVDVDVDVEVENNQLYTLPYVGTGSVLLRRSILFRVHQPTS
jgi:hypothetical protein